MSKITKLLWMDLEMTGLDVLEDRILEVAAIVTDMDFNELDRYHAVVKQPEHVVDHMNAWSIKQHKQSGLTEKIATGTEESLVEQELINFTKEHFKASKVIIAGNSIHFDRRFMAQHWREFESMLHYRMLDVSSFKILMENKHKVRYQKKESHRALDDVIESINELKYYLEKFKAQ